MHESVTRNLCHRCPEGINPDLVLGTVVVCVRLLFSTGQNACKKVKEKHGIYARMTAPRGRVEDLDITRGQVSRVT